MLENDVIVSMRGRRLVGITVEGFLKRIGVEPC